MCPVWNITYVSEINEHQSQWCIQNSKETYLDDINIQRERIILLILVLQGVGMFHELLTGSRAITSSKLKMVHDYNAGTNNNPEVNSVPSYRVKPPIFQLLQQVARLQEHMIRWQDSSHPYNQFSSCL